MRRSTLLLLARPRSSRELARVKLVAAAAATDGALVLCCARIARVRGDLDGAGGLTPYVAQSGLRFGTVLGGLLLCVPLAALCVQGLRIGASAQARSLAGLRLAGATPGDVRAISAAQSGGCALLGGFLAGPVYLVLTLALGAVPPPGWRLLPPPDVGDLGAWLCVVVLSVIAGALAGLRVQREAITHPLAASRRSPPRLHHRRRGLLLGLCVCALVLSGKTFFSASSLPEAVAAFSIAFSLLVCAFIVGPWAVLLTARVLHRRGTATSVMAAARLAAEPRGPGRVFSVLLICSVAFTFDVEFGLSLVQDQHDLGFYLTGVSAAAAGIFLAAVVAVLTLTVGAADQLLDARRALACLSALGVPRAVLVRAMRRQLLAASLPGAVLGPWLLAVSSLGEGWQMLRHPLMLLEPAALSAGTSLVLATVTVLAALLAARLLQPQLTAALDPANLHAP